jgi:hypothetical protein
LRKFEQAKNKQEIYRFSVINFSANGAKTHTEIPLIIEPTLGLEENAISRLGTSKIKTLSQ